MSSSDPNQVYKLKRNGSAWRSQSSQPLDDKIRSTSLPPPVAPKAAPLKNSINTLENVEENVKEEKEVVYPKASAFGIFGVALGAIGLSVLSLILHQSGS